MTSISWPIILSGDYSDGSVCNAADYKNDFYKLRDAVNQLYERFGSYRISATIRKPFGYTGDATEYITLADDANTGTSFALEGTSTDGTEAARRVVRTLIQVPTWMQGVRIRGLQASNTSQVPYFATTGDPHSVDLKWYTHVPTVGVSVGSAIDQFDWKDSDTTFNTGSGAVDIATLAFGNANSTAHITAVNESVLYAGGAGQSYTEKNAIGGPNWSVFSTVREYRPVMMAATADYVVEPGYFIGLWACGGMVIENKSNAALSGPMFMEYSWDVLLDAMIPIP